MTSLQKGVEVERNSKIVQKLKESKLWRINFNIIFAGILFLMANTSFPMQLENTDEEKSPLVTNVFYETDIREALRDISAQTKIRIIPDETVQGVISVELKDVPLEEALRMILAPGGYTFRKMPEGYYLVGSATPTSPSFSLLTKTEYIKLNYIKAEDAPKLISSFFHPYIQINKETNALIVTAPPEIIARLKKDLAKIDQPPRQITIEAVIVELSEEGRKSLGITWGSMSEGGFSVYPPSSLDYTKEEGKGSYSISGTLSYDLLIRVNTLVSEGKAKIRANPRIATLEGKEAQIYIGKEEWYLINVGTGAQAYYTLQSIPTGVILKITPYVTENNQITVKITPEVSEVAGKGATNLPVVTKRTATTIVRVNDGETIAIGGLLQEQKSETNSGVPLLQNIPLIGSFFRHKKTITTNRDVVIFITPHIMKGKFLVREKIKSQEEHKEAEQNREEEDWIKDYCSYIAGTIQEKVVANRIAGVETPKELILEFTISSDGTVKRVKVLKTSGIPFLDSAAVQAIKNLSPFPPFPKEIKHSKLTLSLPIRYEP